MNQHKGIHQESRNWSHKKEKDEKKDSLRRWNPERETWRKEKPQAYLINFNTTNKT